MLTPQSVTKWWVQTALRVTRNDSDNRGTTSNGPRRPIAQRMAIPVAIAVSLFTYVFLQVLHHIVGATGADFRAVLRGAVDLRAGRDIYAPALHFLSAGNLRGILHMYSTPYVYPPPLALVMRPLTALDPQRALMLWDLLNVTLQGVMFVLVVRLSNARTFFQLCLVAAIYGFFPLNMDLGNGQIDLFITVVGLLSFLFYRSGRLRLAGLLVGAAILIKPTIAVLLLFFAVRRAWRLVLWCCGAVGAGVVVSAMAVGLPVLWEYRTVATG
ncbi:MAG: hypothetical protein JWO42_3435, partial [Chloroflexi bacterium]|nr:hypothetical protein [Chloroflexota bacterium]